MSQPLRIGDRKTGVFPYNRILGEQIIEKARVFSGQLVIEFCAASGKLGYSVCTAIGAKMLILAEIDPLSCRAAREHWHRHAKHVNVVIVEDDLTQSRIDAPRVHALILCNPPHVPLPPSFSGWRNAYGGSDGLFFVRAMFRWLRRCHGDTHFLISTYILTPTPLLTTTSLLSMIAEGDPGVTSIHHYSVPGWTIHRGIDEPNPGATEKILSFYLSRCPKTEKQMFQSKIEANPFMHHILIEGRIGQ